MFGTITVNVDVDVGASEGKETSHVSKEKGKEGVKEEKDEKQKKGYAGAIALAIGVDTLAREDGPVRVGTRGVQKKVGATTISPSVSFLSSAKGVEKAETLKQNEEGKEMDQVKARGKEPGTLVIAPAPLEVKWKFGTADSPEPEPPTIVDAEVGKAGNEVQQPDGEQGSDGHSHQHQLLAQDAHTLLPNPHHPASSSPPSPTIPLSTSSLPPSTSESVFMLTTSISPPMPISTPMSISPSPSTGTSTGGMDVTFPASADPEFEVKDFGFGFGNTRLRDEDEDEGAKESVDVQGEGTESNEIEGHDVDLDGQNVHNDSYAYPHPLLGENLLPPHPHHHHGYSYNYHYNHNHNYQYNYAQNQYPHGGGGGGRGRRGFVNGRGAYVGERERDRGYPHGHGPGGRRGRGTNGFLREYARGGGGYGVYPGHHNQHFGYGQQHYRGAMNARGGGAGSGSGTPAGGSDPSLLYTITPPPPFQPLPLPLVSESSTGTSTSGTGTGTSTGGTVPSLPPPYYHQQLHHHHHQQHFQQPGLGLGVGIGQGLGQRRPYLPPGYEPYASPTIPGMPPPLLLGGFGVGGGMHSPAYAHHGQGQVYGQGHEQGSLEQVESTGGHREQEQEQVHDQGQSGPSDHAGTATDTTPAPGTGKPHLLVPAPVPVPLSTIAFPLDATRYYLLGQLEYYLSTQNLAQDFYLRQQVRFCLFIRIFNLIHHSSPHPRWTPEDGSPSPSSPLSTASVN